MLSAGGCGSDPIVASKPSLTPPPPPASLTAPAVESAKASTAADAPLVKIERAAAELPPSPQRDTITLNLAPLRQWFATNLAAWDTMVEQAKAQDAAIQAVNVYVKASEKRAADQDAKIKTLGDKIAKLEAGDPVVTRLNWAGLACLVAAVAALGVGIWLNVMALRNLSFVLGGVGLAILTLARYLHTLELICGALAGCAVIGAVVYFILHKKISPVVQATRDALKSAPLTDPTVPASSSLNDGAAPQPAPMASAADDAAGASHLATAGGGA